MKRDVFCLLFALLGFGPVAADEGMWPIHRLEEVYPAMRAEGLKLRAEEIYDERTASLAAAVVAVDGGMGSGSMISDEGLMITNHHVAYGDICALSTPARNLLETGFWARTRGEEIPVAGKTVWFLRRVVDVTAEALAIRGRLEAEGKWGVMGNRRLSRELEASYGGRTDCEVSCVSMWGGRRYLMYFYDIYRDVRLVGVPPVTIGAFGGDADNWSWPQHKGDFTLYRVYAAPDGRPAGYSPENVPLRPHRVLPISTGGVGEGDFTMVVGYPGRTNRYESSFAVVEKRTVRNPVVVKSRRDRMEIIRGRMERSPEVRMAYSDAYFNLSNYADCARWENKCLYRFGVAERRRAEEAAMQRWIEADSSRRAEYGTLLADLERGYAARRDAERDLCYFRETWLGPSQALLAANRVVSYLGRLERTGRDTLRPADEDARSVVEGYRRLCDGYNPATDRDLLARSMASFTASVPRGLWGAALRELFDAAGGDADRMAREAFDASFCADAERYRIRMSADVAAAELLRDPLVALAGSVQVRSFTGAVAEAERRAGVDVSHEEARYGRLLCDFRASTGRAQYPDANSTMRLSYGTVEAVAPSDGVHYDARSTAAGYSEKCDPDTYEYRVDDRMRRLVASGDWGRWGEKGVLYVDFITDNDITGGNSGSPVLDARGRLVGLAFDGNRESMAGDVWYHPELARTVCVDIRFVMWVIEKYAGATWLLDELTFER